MFDLPSMLGEYLLPLLLLVPLAVVVVLVVTRQQKEEPWQQRAAEPPPAPVGRPAPLRAPTPELADEIPRSATAYAPTEPAALDTRGYAPSEPAPLSAMTPSVTPFVAAIEVDAPAPAELPPVAPPRRRASDALPSPAAPAGGPLP
ncbi:MAG: hypothetical protein ACK4F7_09495, partial [Inhella sp.]